MFFKVFSSFVFYNRGVKSEREIPNGATYTVAEKNPNSGDR